MKESSVSRIRPEEVARRLSEGHIAVVPTETVYGLAVIPGNPDALKRVYNIKGRPREFNLPVVIGSETQLAKLAVDFNELAGQLAKTFWPGPLTLVLGFVANSARPTWLEGRVEVAVRFPAHEFLCQVAQIAGPFFLTSANAHGLGPFRTAKKALDSLTGAVDFVVDGGTITSTPSTIVNVRTTPGRIERIGAIDLAMLAEFVNAGSVVVATESL